MAGETVSPNGPGDVGPLCQPPKPVRAGDRPSQSTRRRGTRWVDQGHSSAHPKASTVRWVPTCQAGFGFLLGRPHTDATRARRFSPPLDFTTSRVRIYRHFLAGSKFTATSTCLNCYDSRSTPASGVRPINPVCPCVHRRRSSLTDRYAEMQVGRVDKCMFQNYKTCHIFLLFLCSLQEFHIKILHGLYISSLPTSRIIFFRFS
jgi:hypothetical protein